MELSTPKNECEEDEAKWKPQFRVVRKKRSEREGKREKTERAQEKTEPDTRERKLGVSEQEPLLEGARSVQPSCKSRRARTEWEGDTRQAHANITVAS